MLSDIASIATLILFLFYLIGRCITILTVNHLWKDKVIIGNCEDTNYGAIEEIRDYNNKNDQPYGYLVSKQGIRDLKVYSAEFIEDSFGTRKGSLLLQVDFLNIDEAVAFYVMPGDLYPTLFVEYTTLDYMKVSLEWKVNLKSGVFSEFVRPKHTIKSFFYYFLR